VQATQDPPTESFTLRLDFFKGRGFPVKSYPYQLQLTAKVGDHVVGVSKAVPVIKKGNEGMQATWMQSLKELRVQLPATTSQIPHVHIYVHEKRIVEGGRPELRRLGFLQVRV